MNASAPLPRRRLAAALAAFGLLAALPSSLGAAPAGEEKIVSVGGAVTEIVAALGAADRIVAVDTTSTHPAEAVAGKPNVGYMRQLSAEGVLSFAPARVVAVEGSGPPAVLKILREAGMTVDMVPDGHSAEGLAAKIQHVGMLIGRPSEAAALAADVAAHFERLAAERAKIARPARALFVLTVQNGRPMVAGSGTAADAILRLAGAENVAAGFQGYKVMTDEAVMAAAPEVVVTMQRHGAEDPAALMAGLPALAGSPAAKSGAVVAMDGLFLLGFGPRTPEAAEDLMRAIAARRPEGTAAR